MSRPLVGLDMFHYAPVLTDSTGGTTYDTPVHVINITAANINFNSDIATFFADDGPREVTSQVGEVDLEINIADLPPDDYAFLIGATHVDGVVDYTSTAIAPEVAVGFRAKKSSGAYRYLWLSKGKFGVPNAEHQTKEGSVNFQPQTIKGKFMARISDDKIIRRTDSDDTTLPVGVNLLADWFDDPDHLPAVLNITGLATSPGTLAPSFSEGVKSYEVDVTSVTATIDVTVTSTDDITIAGVAAVTATPQTVTLGGAGTTTEIAIVITSGAVSRTYILNVNRAA